MTPRADRKPGRAGMIVGLLAWLILTLVPVLHGHHPAPQHAGSQADWSCTLCAVSSVPELSDGKPIIQAPTDISWLPTIRDAVVTAESDPWTHAGRAPPAPLT